MPEKKETSILLLGAGELGTALLTHISHLPNTKLTVGVRTPSSPSYASLITDLPNVRLLALDLTDPSERLVPVFAEYDVIICATGFTGDISGGGKLAREVLEAGKMRLERRRGVVDGEEEERGIWFFPWQWGVDYDSIGDAGGLMPLFGAQQRVRNLLRAEAAGCGVKWSVVSTGMFMSFLFETFWGIVDRLDGGGGQVRIRCLNHWDHRVTVTAVEDIGRVLSRILVGDVDAENRVLYVAGDTLSYEQLADIIGRVSGKEVVRETWELKHLEEELGKDPEDQIKRYRVVFAGNGVAWGKEGTVNEDLGMGMVGVEGYAREWYGGTNRETA